MTLIEKLDAIKTAK